MTEYISRQAAIEALRDYFDDQISWEGIGSFVAECCEETINDIPAADVRENKHGRWVARRSTIIHIYYECDQCGNIIQTYPTEYCDNCGAKMEVDNG